MAHGYQFGGEEEYAVANLLDKYTLSPSDRLFAPIYDLLIILASIANAASVMVGGTTHTIQRPAMRINSHRTQTAYALPLGGPLQLALRETIPERIEIGIVPFTETDLPNAKIKTRGLDQIVHHVISPIFLMFFERYNDWLTRTHGDCINWPATLNFCRVVRNAIAHGKINIRNPGSPAVTWRGLSYDYKSNGRTIIGGDLRIGDILGLMFEANEDLNNISAPVL